MLDGLWEAREPVDRAELHRRLDELLICGSNPSGHMRRSGRGSGVGPAPKTVMINGVEHHVDEVRRGKDETTFWALWIAQGLVVSTVGWAINHRWAARWPSS